MIEKSFLFFKRHLKVNQVDSILNFDFFKNGFLLLLPGLLSSLAIVFISSGNWNYINKSTSFKLLQIIQFQMLGLTICKFGVDQIGYAVLQGNPGMRLNFQPILIYRVIPLSFVYSILIAPFAGLLPAFILFVNLCCEVFCLVVIAELNVSKEFNKISFLVFTGYPSMLLCLIVYSVFFTPSIVSLSVFLFLSSATKALFSYKFRIRSTKYLTPSLHFNIVLQQLLNFVLFRIDQILIFSVLAANYFFVESSINRNGLVYLTKYPEFVNGILTNIWVLYLPALTKDFVSSIKSFAKNHLFFLASLIAGSGLVGIFHYLHGHYNYINAKVIYVCFFVNSLLGIPANMITFYFFKIGKINRIIRLEIYSLLAGLFLFCFSFWFKNIWLFIILVPFQLFVYTILFLLWRRKSE